MKTSKFESLKKKLLTIEGKIRYMVGDDADSLNQEAFKKPRNLKRLGKLLFDRCCTLNRMFLGTEEEIKHVKIVNEHLLALRNSLHERTTKLYESIINVPSFDDDYEIDGVINVSYNGEESVLKLETDSIYGSDFNLMISVLDYYYWAINRRSLIPSVGPNSSNRLDDGVSWSQNELFRDIIICHDFYVLYFTMEYSFCDIIRLNDFWAEATLTCQSITTQSGERFTVIK